MNLLETVLSAQSGEAVGQVARTFGLNQDQTRSAIATLVPALSAGLARNASSQEGLQGLLSALSGGHHQAYLDDPSSLARPETREDGNGILGHVLGSKDVSRQVARAAAVQTGVGEDVLKRMLPIVATMVMGALSQRRTELGLQAEGNAVPVGLSSFLDANQDGSIADDVLGMVGRLFQK